MDATRLPLPHKQLRVCFPNLNLDLEANRKLRLWIKARGLWKKIMLTADAPYKDYQTHLLKTSPPFCPALANS